MVVTPSILGQGGEYLGLAPTATFTTKMTHKGQRPFTPRNAEAGLWQPTQQVSVQLPNDVGSDNHTDIGTTY